MLQILAVTALFQAAVLAPQPDSTRVSPTIPPSAVSAPEPWTVLDRSDSGSPQRVHAVTLSDWYYRRLMVHRIGSYVELPLFAGEYLLGHELLTGTNIPRWVKPTHLVTAEGLGVLFTSNTITGVWNLIDGWPPPGSHRALLLTHTALMLGADAGFFITGRLGRETNNNFNNATRHEHSALISIGTATAGTAIMWLWNR